MNITYERITLHDGQHTAKNVQVKLIKKTIGCGRIVLENIIWFENEKEFKEWLNQKSVSTMKKQTG